MFTSPKPLITIAKKFKGFSRNHCVPDPGMKNMAYKCRFGFGLPHRGAVARTQNTAPHQTDTCPVIVAGFSKGSGKK